jgi:hypothetical protein
MAEQTKLTALHFRQIYERSDDNSEKFVLGIQDMNAYNDWVVLHEQQSTKLVWDEVEWVERILNNDYHNPEQVDALLRLQELPEAGYVVIGEYGLIGYRMKVGRAILNATVPATMDFATLMPPELLGFIRNISVDTPKIGELRRNGSIVSLTSTLAKEVDDPRKDSVAIMGNDDTGFIFFQLGSLEYAIPEQWKRRCQGVSEDDITWTVSPHVVVIKVEDDGQGSGVYILPTTCARKGPFSHELHSGVKIAKTFEGVGGPQWFLSSRGGPDDIEPPFEYVSAILDCDGTGRRVVREYMPLFSDEEDTQGLGEHTDGEGEGAAEDEKWAKDLFEG